MGAGATMGSESIVRKVGFALSMVGWAVLAMSLFLHRAESPLGMNANRLIGYQPVGILLVILLASILPAILFARRLPVSFTWMLAGLWLLTSTLTIYAGFNLDYTFSGSLPPGWTGYAEIPSGTAAAGTTLSIIGANLGFVGTGLMAWPSRDA